MVIIVEECIRAERRASLTGETAGKKKGYRSPPLPPFLQVEGGAVCFIRASGEIAFARGRIEDVQVGARNCVRWTLHVYTRVRATSPLGPKRRKKTKIKKSNFDFCIQGRWVAERMCCPPRHRISPRASFFERERVTIGVVLDPDLQYLQDSQSTGATIKPCLTSMVLRDFRLSTTSSRAPTPWPNQRALFTSLSAVS